MKKLFLLIIYMLLFVSCGDDVTNNYITNPIVEDSTATTIIQFNISENNNIVTLTWTTSIEKDNYGFEVERNYNGWQTIGFVQGYGNSSSPKYYSFEDTLQLSGIYNYRLKQIDDIGTIIFTLPLEIEIDMGIVNELIDVFVFNSGINFNEYTTPVLLDNKQYALRFNGIIQNEWVNFDSTEYVITKQDAFFRFYYEYTNIITGEHYIDTTPTEYLMIGVNPNIYSSWYPTYSIQHLYEYSFDGNNKSIYLNSDRFGDFNVGNITISIYKKI